MRCLLVMVHRTQWLPVALIPEQSSVATMRYNMIDHRCWCQATFLHAFRAQWVLLQEGFSCSPPFCIVTTGVSATAKMVAAPHQVVLAEHLTLFAEAGATGVAAGSGRGSRHNFHLLFFFTSQASTYRGCRIRCCHHCSSRHDPMP